MITIYHNPRCAKSRECLLRLEKIGEPFEIIKYLVDTPTYEELFGIIKKLNLKPLEVVRQKEPIWIALFKNKKLSDKQIIQAMVDHPILIERPIVVNGDKAVIARPIENFRSII